MKKYLLLGLLAMTLSALLQGTAFTAEASPVLKIDYAGNRISADLTNAPLSRVLEAIHEKTGIEYQLNTNIEELPISVAFSHLTLEDGLKKILVRVNNAIIFGPGREIRKIVIFNKLDKAFPDAPMAASREPGPVRTATPRPPTSSRKKEDIGHLAMVPTPLPPPNGHGPATGPSPIASKKPESVSDQDASQEGPTPITPSPDDRMDGPAAAALPVAVTDSRNNPGVPVTPLAPDVPVPQ